VAGPEKKSTLAPSQPPSPVPSLLPAPPPSPSLSQSPSSPPLPPLSHALIPEVGSEFESEAVGDVLITSDVGGLGGGETESEAVGAEGTPAPTPPSDASVHLQHHPGTLIDVHWGRMGKTYRGEVKRVEERDGEKLVIVYYREDDTYVRHAFDTDDCSFDVAEPPLHTLWKMRRTADNSFEGKMPPPNQNNVYKLGTEDVESHFDQTGEREWVDALVPGGGWGAETRVPAAGKAKPKTARKAKKPKTKPVPSTEVPAIDCVPTSLSKAFAFACDSEAAAIVSAHKHAIISAKGVDVKGQIIDHKGDRVKYAAEVVASRCHYWPRKKGLATCALEADRGHVTLFQLKSVDGTCRSHAITTYAGMIFDSAEPDPLPLSRENLSHVLGVEYGGVVGGYVFVPQPKAEKRARDGSGDLTRAKKKPSQ
jgi:hypothetical protein